MVLQSFAADNVADRKEKIIAIVVMRIEKLLRLDRQVLVVLQFFRSNLEIGRLVGEDIEVHRIVRPRRQVQALEVDARIKRRVDQRIQRRLFELNQVAVLRFHVQRAGELPSLRQTQRSFEFDIPREVSRRIEKHSVPGNVGELRGNTTSFWIERGEVLEVYIQRLCILRHFDMECIHVHAVAHPGDAFAIRCDHKAGQFAHRIRWRMCPGKPLRVEQRNVAAFYRDCLMHIQHAICDVGGIDEQRNRAGIRRVSRRNNGRRQRYRLWAR